MKYIISILSVILALPSCENSNIVNRYYYLSKDKAKDVGYPYGSMIYKSNRENVYDDIIIQADVLQYSNDKEYIMIVQKPSKEIIRKELIDDIKFWNNYYVSNKKDSTIKILHTMVSLKEINSLMNSKKELNENVDSITENESYYKKLFTNEINYWIICIKNDSLIGPLSEREYYSKKSELGISNKLK
jgi:hypothetical protein